MVCRARSVYAPVRKVVGARDVSLVYKRRKDAVEQEQ